MRVAAEELFSVKSSCCCLTGLSLGLGPNILVLFPSLLKRCKQTGSSTIGLHSDNYASFLLVSDVAAHKKRVPCYNEYRSSQSVRRRTDV